MKHKKLLKKLIFSLALALGLGLGTAAVCSFAEVDYWRDSDNINYMYNTDTHEACVARQYDQNPPLSIPNNVVIRDKITVEGIEYTVNRIEGGAFYKSDYGYSIKSVTIPDSVTSIGASAFANCQVLISISIPNSVTSIENRAFKGCTSLKSVTIPEGVTTIETALFQDCSALSSVVLSENITSIASGAFKGCPDSIFTIEDNEKYLKLGQNVHGALIGVNNTNSFATHKDTKIIADDAIYGLSNLRYVAISEGVERIGSSNFRACNKLETVTISSTVKFIGDLVAWQSDNFKSFYVDSGNNYYCSEDGVLYNKEKTNLIKYPENKTETSFTIPNSVNSIEKYAFNRCERLPSITIPSSVTSIGESAFQSAKLTNVTFEEGSQLESIGESAFQGCSRLTSITIPSSVTSIERYALRYCSNLKVAFIPEDATIADDAFENSNSVTAWKYGVLDEQAGAPEGKTLVQITSHDQGSGTSVDCGAMGDPYIIRKNPDNNIEVTHSCGAPTDTSSYFYITDENGIEWECGFDQDQNVYIKPKDKSKIIGDITVPSTATIGCMTYSITIIESVAFADCTNLESVTIQEGITTIGAAAFDLCNSLKRITIPSTVTDIQDVIGGCEKLEEIIVDPNNTKYCAEDGVLYNIDKTELILYPDSKPDASFEIPSSVEKIDNQFTGNTKLEEIIVNPNNTKYCAEDGVLYNIDKTNLICYPSAKKDSSFEIPNTVTEIGKSAFLFCGLTSVTIPEGVTTINDYAFELCLGLTNNVTIPSTVTSIGKSAFYCFPKNIFVPLKDDINIKESSFQNTNIWRYEVLNGENVPQDDKIHVNIKSLSKSTFEGYPGDIDGVPAATSVCCGDMGENYVIESLSDSVEEIDLTHDWNNPTYSWSSLTCSEKRLCKNTTNHTEDLGTVTITPYSDVYDGSEHYAVREDGSFTFGSLQYSTNQTDWSPNIPKYKDAGTYTVYVKPDEDSTIKSVTVTITKATLTITPEDNQGKTYGESDSTLTYQVEGLVGEDTKENTLSGILSRDSGETVGEYAITQGTLIANSNYRISLVSDKKFTISAKELTITPNDNQGKTYGESDPALTYTVTGLVTGDTEENTLSGTLSRETGDAVGEYNITQGTLTANSNYSISFVSDKKFTITAKELTITPEDNQGKTYGEADQTLTYQVEGLVGEDTKENTLSGILSRESGEAVREYAITQGTLTANSNYSISFVSGKKFTISAKTLTSEDVSLSPTTFEYDGSAKIPNVTVTDGSKTLTADTDYTVSYSEASPTNVGTYTVIVTGQGNYSGTVNDKSFTISAKELTSNDVSVSLSQTTFTYNGSAQTPVITVTEGSETLTEDTDYTVNYSSEERVNAGDYTITVEGKGNYSGTVSKQFTINKANLTTASVKLNEDGTVASVSLLGGGQLAENDYEAAYDETTKVVTITVKSDNAVGGPIYARLPDEEHVGGTYYKDENGQYKFVEGTFTIAAGTSPTKYPWGDFIGDSVKSASATANLKDKDGNQTGKKVEVIVQDPFGALPENYKIQIDNVTTNLGKNYDETYPIEYAYKADVTLINTDTSEQISGALSNYVRLLLEIPDDPNDFNDDWDDFETQALRIELGSNDDVEYNETIEYRVYDADGNFVKVVDKDYKLESGQTVKKFIAIWTNHFSEYALVDPEDNVEPTADDASQTDNSTTEGEKPSSTGANSAKKSYLKTGENLNNIYLLEILLSLSFTALYLSLKKRKS